MPDSGKWEFWIDRGGTFTDIVGRRPDGSVTTAKLLSENPGQYEDAAMEGVRRLLGVETGAPIPTERIAAVKMGTTVATNALLERRGEPTLLAITRGFGDALRIGYQTRPKLFDLQIELPSMLYAEVAEIDERIGPRGETVTPLDEVDARRKLQAAFDNGLRAVAVVLMHGYRHPGHERRVAEIAREIGFTQVSESHRASPLMKLVPRGDTTVVDAYLSPILRRYVARVDRELAGLAERGGRLLFMQSSGGLTDARFFQGKDAILSGPAGGVVGMARTAGAAGFDKVIGFDMGGTSTDVSHFDGEFERASETEVAGVRLRAPMMLIHTVAAGGGSILHFDGARYRVGPDSAGARPGPASYRNGGPLAVTDCNVMLGRLQPDLFPAVFGPGADQPLDREGVARRFTELAAEIHAATGDDRTPEEVAEGFLAIAVESMANAIKKISVQRGYNITRYTLNCFGGAGGQHACAVADSLGIGRIFIHPHAGVLSAFGMGLADRVTTRERAVERELDAALVAELEGLAAELETEGEAEMIVRGEPGEKLRHKRRLKIRYAGSDTALQVDFRTLDENRRAFEAQHRLRFGFASPEKGLIVESVEVETLSPAEPPALRGGAGVGGTLEPVARYPCRLGGEWRETPFHRRAALPVGEPVEGPAVILDPTATTVVEPGWRAVLTAEGNLVLERHLPRPGRVAVGTHVDPVMLEIFNNLFMNIAEQMGVVLENTAASVNIKERLDFSCAVFDTAGALVANAPHIPVHLGSMSESIRTVIARNRGRMAPGDAFILNDPYHGGTHLPDVTVVKPVFDAAGERVLFYTAARGHHADIGGRTPGSMPPDSTTLEEEGVLIDNFRLVERGRFREAEMRELLASGAWPARNPDMNIADFKAQLAACEKGVQELVKMVDHFGLEVVHAYMGHVQDNAEGAVRRLLGDLRDGRFRYEMDDGSTIRVAITVERHDDPARRRARFDFSGTSPRHPGNFNAPTAIVRAAVLYVLRCLVDDEIPLNEGCLKPVEIIIPEGSMISPEYPAAVVAGNVETSQYLVDTLLGALGAAAGSQGTMNNFTWGNRRHQYYETLCGGAGAIPGHDGADAVHTHMTNSRLTDAEVLEWRFPVRLESFAIRRNSGGAGRWRGGDGVVRRVRFLEPMEISLLSGHRRIPPYGIDGGLPGKVGRTRIERADGTCDELGACDRAEVEAGDAVIIETPGGGGCGSPGSGKRRRTGENG